MSQNLSSAAVVIGALRVNRRTDKYTAIQMFSIIQRENISLISDIVVL